MAGEFKIKNGVIVNNTDPITRIIKTLSSGDPDTTLLTESATNETIDVAFARFVVTTFDELKTALSYSYSSEKIIFIAGNTGPITTRGDTVSVFGTNTVYGNPLELNNAITFMGVPESVINFHNDILLGDALFFRINTATLRVRNVKNDVPFSLTIDNNGSFIYERSEAIIPGSATVYQSFWDNTITSDTVPLMPFFVKNTAELELALADTRYIQKSIMISSDNSSVSTEAPAEQMLVIGSDDPLNPTKIYGQNYLYGSIVMWNGYFEGQGTSTYHSITCYNQFGTFGATHGGSSFIDSTAVNWKVRKIGSKWSKIVTNGAYFFYERKQNFSIKEVVDTQFDITQAYWDNSFSKTPITANTVFDLQGSIGTIDFTYKTITCTSKEMLLLGRENETGDPLDVFGEIDILGNILIKGTMSDLIPSIEPGIPPVIRIHGNSIFDDSVSNTLTIDGVKLYVKQVSGPAMNINCINGGEFYYEKLTGAGVTITGTGGKLYWDNTINPGLIRGAEGINSGYWLDADIRNNKGDIGEEAVDLSYSWLNDKLYGATGQYSFASGVLNLASGYAAHVEGESNIVAGRASHAEGYGNLIASTSQNSHVEGQHNEVHVDNAHAEGYGNIITIDAPVGAHVHGFAAEPVGAEQQSVIGLGYYDSNISDYVHRNGFVLWTDGTATLPFSDYLNITGRGPTAIATKGYVDTVGNDKVSSVVGGTNIIIDNTNPNYPVISSTGGTTAGLIDRSYYTGDVLTTPAGTFRLMKRNDKGTVDTFISTVTCTNGATEWYVDDFIGPTSTIPVTIYAGQYTSIVKFSANSDSGQQQFTSELYLTDTNGNVIDSGLNVLPDGNLGVEPLLVMNSGTIDMPNGIVTAITLAGTLVASKVINPGQRLRHHFAATKVASSGPSVTFSRYAGSSFGSYIDVSAPITTDTVINLSSVSGAYTTDVLNSLNTNKAPLANPAFTGIPTAPTAAIGTNTTQLATTAFVTREIVNTEKNISGVISGGGVSYLSATQLQIASGTGRVIDSFTNPTNSPNVDLTWNITTFTPTLSPTSIVNYVILRNSSNTLTNAQLPITEKQRRDNIIHGYFTSNAGAIVQASIVSSPLRINNVGNAFYSYLNYIGYRSTVKGLVANPISNSLSLYTTSGTIFLPDSNLGNVNDPSVKPIPANGSTSVAGTFAYFGRNSVPISSNQTVVPKLWDNNGTTTAMANGRFYIHYLYEGINGELYLQLAQYQYDNWSDANGALSADRSQFIPSSVVTENLVSLVAQIILGENSTVWAAGNADIYNVSSTTTASTIVSPDLYNVLLEGDSAGGLNIKDIGNIHSEGISTPVAHWEIKVQTVETLGTVTVSGSSIPEYNGTYTKNNNIWWTKDATHHLAKGSGGDWYWNLCSDRNNIWNTTVYFGAGGLSDPVAGGYQPYPNGGQGTPINTVTVLDAAPAKPRYADALYTNGSIRVEETVKSGRGFEVMNKFSFGLDVLDQTVISNQVVPTSGYKIRFTDSPTNNYFAIDFEGTPSAPLCDPAKITQNKHLITKEYFDLHNAGGGGSATWGTITGTLSAQTDLQTALNAKEPTLAAAPTTPTTRYYRGDKSWQTLNTTAVTEGTNLYYTNARGIGSTLTGYVAGSGTIAAGDSILGAIQKLGFDKHVAVTLGANSGLTLATQTLAMGTPGTITNATTNSITGASHTHALTLTLKKVRTYTFALAGAISNNSIIPPAGPTMANTKGYPIPFNGTITEISCMVGANSGSVASSFTINVNKVNENVQFTAGVGAPAATMSIPYAVPPAVPAQIDYTTTPSGVTTITAGQYIGIYISDGGWVNSVDILIQVTVTES